MKKLKSDMKNVKNLNKTWKKKTKHSKQLLKSWKEHEKINENHEKNNWILINFVKLIQTDASGHSEIWDFKLVYSQDIVSH